MASSLFIGQSRKADVDAVNERDDLEKEEKGKKSDLQFPNRALFDGAPTAGYHGASGFAAGGHIELRLQWHESSPPDLPRAGPMAPQRRQLCCS
jgi:hypothetical protein